MNFGPQYLTFKIAYAKFPVKLFIDEHSTHTNEHPLVESLKSVRY